MLLDVVVDDCRPDAGENEYVEEKVLQQPRKV